MLHTFGRIPKLLYGSNGTVALTLRVWVNPVDIEPAARLAYECAPLVQLKIGIVTAKAGREFNRSTIREARSTRGFDDREAVPVNSLEVDRGRPA